MSELDNHLNRCSEFLLRGPSPHMVSGWFLQFLMWKFSTLGNLHHPALHHEKYLWRPDDTAAQEMTKGILIAMTSDYRPNDAQQRPAVLLQRGPQMPEYGALGTIGGNRRTPSMHLLGDGHDPNRTPTLGQNEQLVWIGGTHTLFCIHGSGGGAEILGIEMWSELIDRMPQIRTDCFLKEVKVGQLTPARKLREFKESWVTALVVLYKYQHATLQIQEAPIFRGMTVESEIV